MLFGWETDAIPIPRAEHADNLRLWYMLEATLLFASVLEICFRRSPAPGRAGSCRTSASWLWLSDVLVILVSLVDLTIVSPFVEPGASVARQRLFRIVRLVKLWRTRHIISFVLRTGVRKRPFLQPDKGAFFSLFWGAMLLLFFVYGAAVLLAAGLRLQRMRWGRSSAEGQAEGHDPVEWTDLSRRTSGHERVSNRWQSARYFFELLRLCHLDKLAFGDLIRPALEQASSVGKNVVVDEDGQIIKHPRAADATLFPGFVLAGFWTTIGMGFV